jgi:hypothetical protein
MPPTLEEHQALVSDFVEPALVDALSLLGEVDDPEFVFFLTPGMQGEDPIGTPTLELDQSEVLALRAALETAVASIDVFLAYRTVPSPYGPAGFSAAMEEGSTFLSLDPGEAGRLTDARERLLRAVDLMDRAFDFMVAETDDQADDVVRYEPAGPPFDCDLEYTGRAFPCRMNRLDVQDVRDVLADIGGMLAGPYTVVRGIGLGSDDDFLLQDVVVDASKFFVSPISDLKALLPAYEVSEGDFHWVALAFDEWLFPDPSLNGILPNVTTTNELKAIVGGDGLWQDAAYEIDTWGSITVNPNNGGISAMTKLGDLYWISSDFSSGSDRPDLTGVGNSWDPIHLTFSAAAPELLAIEYEGRIYGRPDDQASAWSERINLSAEPWWYCCGFSRLVKSPNASSYYTNNYGNILEIASDFSSVSLRPYLPYDISGMAANTATVELVGISYDGLLFARPPDETTEWSQRYALPFTGRWDDRWQAITQAPADGDMFAITRSGDLYEISADLSTETNRPDVPATNVVDLIASPAGLLIALTEDGRVFSRFDDESSQWTLRYRLPRNLIP